MNIISVILLASLIRVIARVRPLHEAIGNSAVLDTGSLLVEHVLFLQSILQVVEFLHVLRCSQPLLGDIHVLQDELLDHFAIGNHDFRLPRSRRVHISWPLLLVFFQVLVSPCRWSERSLGQSSTERIWDCLILL